MTLQQDTPANGQAVSVVDRSQTWYAAEVPSIVAGLQISRAISATTAEAAWRLIEDGSYDRALSVALGEAF